VGEKNYLVDVAVTLTLLDSFPLRPSFLLQAPVLWAGRPLEAGKLAYYGGWPALRRLCA
jgi:hypothetical protein